MVRIPFHCHRSAAVLVLTLLAGTPVLAQDADQEPSLFDRLGGLQPISLLVDEFVDDFIADPVIMANPAVRERKSPENAPYLKYHLTTILCEATGGPCQYTGVDLRTAHEGLNVTAGEWDRMAEIFGQSLADHRVPEREQEEIFAILGPTRDDIVTVEDR
jgi:hemoglobin